MTSEYEKRFAELQAKHGEKVLIFSTIPIPDWILQHMPIEPNPPSTFGEFITRYATSEPEMQELTARWKRVEPPVFVDIDFGETEARIMAWLQGRADGPREIRFEGPKGDARELIKEMPVSDGKRQFTLSPREQLAQQRRDAKRRR